MGIGTYIHKIKKKISPNSPITKIQSRLVIEKLTGKIYEISLSDHQFLD